MGNIGIATANPKALFDVGNQSANSLKSVLARLAEGDGTGEGTYLGVKSYNSQPEGGTSCCNIKSFALEHKFYGNLNNAINFYRGGGVTGGYITIAISDGTEKFIFNNSGLDVDGTIRAKEVKVTLEGWSDFVFHPAYCLKPLTEVEQYIKANGHLENIPTATEVEQNGVNVGDMQAKLLEKVEQLTLYSIELKKENIEQQKQNTFLQQELADQKAVVAAVQRRRARHRRLVS